MDIVCRMQMHNYFCKRMLFCVLLIVSDIFYRNNSIMC